MKAIRVYLLGLLFTYGLCLSQNIDSLNSVYGRYYETALLTVSPTGKYVVLNHNNTYGKDEDELFDVSIGKGMKLDKHNKYKFLNDNLLLMRNDSRCRISNLKTGQYNEVLGNYVFAILHQSEQVILYDTGKKELLLLANDGNVVWKEYNIEKYQFDDTNHRLIYISANYIGIKNLKNQKSRTFKLESAVQWMSYSAERIYAANIQASKIKLYVLDLLTNKVTRHTIGSPEEFEFTANLNSYVEMRENSRLILPLYSKSKLNAKKNPELQVSYSNRNGNEKRLNHHLGIYNISEKKWDYEPDARQILPVYKFLNEKGDFIVFDQSEDVVEEQQNVVLNLNLILDYGKKFYLLPKKRIDDGNYLWDHDTKQFIYFDFKRWRCLHIDNGEDHDLLPPDTNGWENLKNNGLLYAPESSPIKIKGSSRIMFCNQFDYFIVDLKNHKLQSVTKGADQNIKYKLQVSNDKYPESSLNVRLPEIDLGKELTFTLFNLLTYNTGFANYMYKNNRINLQKQGHYKEMIPYKKGFFLTSQFALEPFKLTRFEKGKYKVIYESLKTEKEIFGSTKYQIFHYETKYGKSNAALLFPLDYDQQKKYPMIVNIYDQKSLDLLYFMPPFLATTFGFNYMHYLMNGYIVLLPDLQYETANVKNSVITSLEKSIDTAKLLAPIDDSNIGVVGLSFGGFETGLVLTNSRYFKTGVAGVMISDMISHSLSYSEFNSMPNYRRTENQQLRMNTDIFENWNGYLENSPIYHMKNINAPVLIWTGSKDKNISPAQSQMFFLGMKRLQKKAAFLEYSNETHNVLLKSNQLDLNLKIWQWFDHYLKNKSPADWIEPLTK